MGRYDPDSDSHLRWRISQAAPDEVILVDAGVDVIYPWTSWSAARGAADASQGTWDNWNNNSHPSAEHRAWYAEQTAAVRARLRQRARMISASVP